MFRIKFYKKPSFETKIIVCAVICLLVGIVFRSLAMSINIPFNHIDGTFQTSSGLYRLDAGLCPGKDFLPYLGVGLLYFIYPLFKIAGANVFAAMFASQAMTFISAALSVLTVCLLCLRGRLLYSILIASALLSIGMFVAPYDLPSFIFDRLRPAQSLRPIRSLAPYLSFLFAYLLLTWHKKTRLNAIILGAVGGLCVLWSNDFGLPCIFALSGLLIALWRLSICSVRDLFAYAVSLITTAILCLTIATCGSPLSLISYNFIDIAQDQWWYFGPWSLETRLYSPFDLGKVFKTSEQFALALGLSGLVCVLAFVTKKIEHIVLAWLTIAIFLGTLIVTVGGHIELGYLNPLVFHAFLVGIFLPLGYLVDSRTETESAGSARIGSMTVSIAFLLLTLGIAIHEALSYLDESATAQDDSNRFYVTELGGFLPSNWRNYVQRARESTGTSVEEYWGIWSAIRGGEKILPVDSVIHALGGTREVAKHAFSSKPIDHVVTTRLGFSNWQAWSMSSNWWLYRHLILHYTPYANSRATVLWKPSDQTINTKSIDCTVTQGKGWFIAAEPGLYDVSIVLANTQPRGRHLLLVRNGLVHAMRSQGWLSLPLAGQKKDFPMLVFEKGRQAIELSFQGLAQEQQPDIASCVASYIDFEHPDVFVKPLPRPTTVNISNQLWYRGVARTAPKFIVMDTQQNRARFISGRTVKFSEGSTRRITDVLADPPYLEISYSGWRLDGSAIGNPSSLTVVETP